MWGFFKTKYRIYPTGSGIFRLETWDWFTGWWFVEFYKTLEDAELAKKMLEANP